MFSQSKLYDNVQKFGIEYLDQNIISEYITIDEFINRLNFGDIIFSRSDTIFGKLIQLSGHCIWNHVAMCVPCPDTGEKCWWESAKNPEINEDSFPESCRAKYNSNLTGVKLWSIRNRLKFVLSTPGSFLNVAVAHIQKNKSTLSLLKSTQNTQLSLYISNMIINTNGVLDDKKVKKLYNFIKTECGKPYEKSLCTLIFAWFDGMATIKNLLCYDESSDYATDYYGDKNDSNDVICCFSTKNKRDTSEYFCSELIVETLIQSGIFNPTKSENIISSEWTVSDCANTFKLNSVIENDYRYNSLKIYIIHN